MAIKFKLKRGTSTPTTSDLDNGEVGVDTSAKIIYILARTQEEQIKAEYLLQERPLNFQFQIA